VSGRVKELGVGEKGGWGGALALSTSVGNSWKKCTFFAAVLPSLRLREKKSNRSKRLAVKMLNYFVCACFRFFQAFDNFSL
jgi:hypothetical protein